MVAALDAVFPFNDTKYKVELFPEKAKQVKPFTVVFLKLYT